MDLTMEIQNPMIRFERHGRDVVSFVCRCGKYHSFCESGAIYHQPTSGRSQGGQFVFVQCPCGVWHGQPFRPM
jgi:hypothetical protein